MAKRITIVPKPLNEDPYIIFENSSGKKIKMITQSDSSISFSGATYGDRLVRFPANGFGIEVKGNVNFENSGSLDGDLIGFGGSHSIIMTPENGLVNLRMLKVRLVMLDLKDLPKLKGLSDQQVLVELKDPADQREIQLKVPKDQKVLKVLRVLKDLLVIRGLKDLRVLLLSVTKDLRVVLHKDHKVVVDQKVLEVVKDPLVTQLKVLKDLLVIQCKVRRDLLETQYKDQQEDRDLLDQLVVEVIKDQQHRQGRKDLRDLLLLQDQKD